MRYLRVPHVPVGELLVAFILLTTLLGLLLAWRQPRIPSYQAQPQRRRRRLWLILALPLSWALLTLPILQPSPHSARNWRSAIPEWLVRTFVSVGLAEAPLVPVNPDLNQDGRIDIKDIGIVSGCFMHPPAEPACAAANVNHDAQINVTDIVLVASRWNQAPTALIDSSPVNGDANVAVTRETIIRFSAPLDVAAVVPSNIYASFGGQSIGARLYLSADLKTVTLFYNDDLPASARIRVTVNGDAMADANGYAVDVDGDGVGGGVGHIDFDTLSLSSVPGTVVCGRVYATELGPNGDVPLPGVRITVDGAEATMRVNSDANGNFCLNPAPAGRFFVHIDGRTATTPVPPGAYYPFVGKQWEGVAGQTTNVPYIYLPLIAPDTLQAVSSSQATTIAFPPSVIQAHPEFSRTQIIVPADSLFANNGTRGGSVGIAPVPPDRLPSPLPSELHFPIVITVQTNGPENFDAPVPVCFPNLPDPVTQTRPFPGTKLGLYSFNHDTGRFEVVAPMTVSADGGVACTDPGYGILAPGWHGVQPGARGKGGPILPPTPFNCPGINPLTQCCTPNGAVPRTTITDLASCPNRIPKPNYVPVPNGCGPEGYGYAIPDCAPITTGLGSVSYVCFTEACNSHDVCYGSCNSTPGNKNVCDGNFLTDMHFKCDSEFPNDPVARSGCYAAAEVYYAAVNKTSIGNDAYNAGQQDACDCCAGAQQAPTAATPDSTAASRAASLLVSLTALDDNSQSPSAAPAAAAPSAGLASPAARFLLSATGSTGTVTAVNYDLSQLSTGVHYYAIKNMFTAEIVQRGHTGSQGIAHENLYLQARVLYREFVLQPSTLLVGWVDYTTPFDGFTVNIPPIYLGNSTAPDTDGDGLNDEGELVVGTNPNNPDTDGDGISDSAEIQQGTDPLGGLIAQTGIIATAQTPGTAVDICASNNVAAVAELEGGVSLFNVFNSMNPTIAAHVPTPGSARSIACGSDLLAVADDSAGLALIDFSDPPAAHITHQVSLGGSVQAVAIAGSLVYAGLSDGTVAVVDAATGVVLRTINVGNGVYDLALDRDILLVLRYDELRAYQADQGNLSYLGSAPISGFIPESRTNRKRLFAGGGYAYVTSYPGYDVINTQNPAAMQRVGNATDGGPNSFKQIVLNGSGLGVAAVGVIPADNTHDIWLYNTTSPSVTNAFLTLFQTPGVARAVALYNGLAYVADSSNGLQVINYLAYDAAGVPPTISVTTNFASGLAEEGKPLRITAAVTDDAQVRNVEFYVNGVRQTIDGNFPFELRTVTPLLAQGASFTVRAKATDTGGNVTWSALQTITLTADATPPQVRLVSPTEGSILPTGSLSAVAVTFSEPISTTSLTNGNFTLFTPGPDGLPGTPDDVPVNGGTIEFHEDANIALLSFPAPLAASIYRLVVTTGVTDRTGNHLQAPSATLFTVKDPVRWISDSSGFWDVGSNWNTGAPPGSTDFAVIDRPAATITVTFRTGTTNLRGLTSMEALAVTGGSLGVAEPSDLYGPVTFTGGAMQGAGTWVFHGGLTWTGGGMYDTGGATIPAGATLVVDGGVTIWNRTLNNAGLIRWTGAATWSGANAAVINNLAGATFEVRNDQSFNVIQVGVTINNYGTFRKLASNGVTIINGGATFNNLGVVDVQSGTLRLTGGGTHRGTFSMAASTVLDLPNGSTHNLNGVTFSGAGLLQLSGATVNVDGPVTAPLVSMTSGNLNGSGTITFTQVLTWTGGNMNSNSGITVIPTGATLTVDGPVAIWNRTLNNAGLIRWTGAADWAGANGTIINNLAGATFEVRNDRSFNNIQAGTTINNYGAFRKLASNGVTIINGGVTFNNLGVVDVQSGTLRLTGGGTQSSGFTMAAGTVLDLPNGSTHNLSGVAFSGAGLLSLSGATVNINGPVTAPLVSMTSGNLNGAGVITFTQVFTWTGGAMNTPGGVTVIPTGATLTVDGPVTIWNRTLNNAGLIRWTGAADWAGANGTIINNLAGATFEVRNDRSFNNIQAGTTINNYGAFRKLASNGVTTINGGVTFNNLGVVDVQSGTLRLTGGGTQSSGFTMAAGTVLDLPNGSTHNLSGVAFSGAGLLQLSGATVNINGPVTAPLVSMTSGNLNGAGVITFTQVFTWTGGAMNTPGGATVIPTGATLTVDGPVTIWNRTLNNAGLIRWTGAADWAGANGTIINNLAGGTFEVRNDRSFNNIQVGVTINNSGTFRKLASNGVSTINGGVTFNNLGVVDVQSGALAFQGGFTQSSGALTLNGGNVSSSSTLTINGGSLAGSGTVTATVAINGSQVQPGGSGNAGTLAIVGSYTQGAGATLAIELGGLTAGTQHDQLTVSGAVTLNGTLNVTLINGFTPVTNDSFVVLTYGSRSGTFATVNGNGQTYTPTYNATNLTLVAQ